MWSFPTVLFLCLATVAHSRLWLPFANFDQMIGTLKEVAMKEHMGEADGSHALSFLAHASRDLLNNLSKFLSSQLSSDETRAIASGLREIFNITSTTPTPLITPRFTPKMIPVTTYPTSVVKPIRKFSFHTTHFPTYKPIPLVTRAPLTTTTTTEPPATTRTTTTSTTSTTPSTTTYSTTTPTTTTPSTTWMMFTTTLPTSAHTWATRPTSTTPYPIWPTTPRRQVVTWKTIQPLDSASTTIEPVAEDEEIFYSSTTMDTIPVSTSIPSVNRRLTTKAPNRPIHVPTLTMASRNNSEICKPGGICSLRLRSFETSDPVFQYAYSHSTIIEDSMQNLLRDTQLFSFNPPLSWHNSVSPEVLQLAQIMMSLYHPSRCLVIGVFTGLGLLGIAEHVDSRGIVVALEHPEYAYLWDKVGLKHAKKMANSHISRIQVRSAEEIEKALPRLAITEPNTFDFIFLDDFKRVNYLDDYEHSVRLLRSGGLLIINNALSNGGVLSGNEYMSHNDKAVRDMNLRIKSDPRVRGSLLPYSGGTWIISKN